MTGMSSITCRISLRDSNLIKSLFHLKKKGETSTLGNVGMSRWAKDTSWFRVWKRHLVYDPTNRTSGALLHTLSQLHSFFLSFSIKTSNPPPTATFGGQMFVRFNGLSGQWDAMGVNLHGALIRSGFINWFPVCFCFLCGLVACQASTVLAYEQVCPVLLQAFKNIFVCWVSCSGDLTQYIQSASCGTWFAVSAGVMNRPVDSSVNPSNRFSLLTSSMASDQKIATYEAEQRSAVS